MKRFGAQRPVTTGTKSVAPDSEAPVAELWATEDQGLSALDDTVLPAFVIGYEGHTHEDSLPEWMHCIEFHRRHASLEATGCVLPLVMNQGEDRAKLWTLTRALVEVSGSWHHDAVYGPQGVEALKAELTKLTGFGRRESPLDAHEIAAMTELLAPYLASPGRVPPSVEGGHDACLRFREVNPSPYFDGWVTASLWYPVSPDEPNEGWTRTDGVWRPGVTYSADIGLELARWMGRNGPPRIFLLWAGTL